MTIIFNPSFPLSKILQGLIAFCEKTLEDSPTHCVGYLLPVKSKITVFHTIGK